MNVLFDLISLGIFLIGVWTVTSWLFDIIVRLWKYQQGLDVEETLQKTKQSKRQYHDGMRQLCALITSELHHPKGH